MTAPAAPPPGTPLPAQTGPTDAEQSTTAEQSTAEPAAAAALWSATADRAQQALTDHFQTRLLGPRLLLNTSPPRLGQLLTFNYWWLAHAVEVRVDGAERRGGRTAPGGTERLRLAQQSYDGIRLRNRGRLFNHYFDDMGWLALAAVRLYDLSGERRCLDDAISLWRYIAENGAANAPERGVAWRDSQLDYRNAPTNGAFAILSARLASRASDPRFDGAANRSLEYIARTFVSGTGDLADLVADGINRQGDGALDAHWLFTYNQGLYIGALVEAFDRTGDPETLERATRTARASIDRLAPTGLFLGEPANLAERGGGDAGLFKGIFVRYLGLLLDRLDPAGDGFRMLGAFLTASTDLLAPNGIPLAADDWSHPPGRTTALSTQLSAVMALEARARFERLALR
ncbi:glycoside hydrolase family 76 protein [Subtercola boreus]|uniref:Glycosyl hydrolase n=1 Tax=Subtercola boreus TaxID=120213 RepID=A0A3E0WAD9_9MICO|nr:glycoside hydrolase family 76 protein [Subtercola boreus]RFA20044.1 hypothetical protein B7R24_10735 [Subtercola boreus]RFA20173.1 hypothetical protein B7R23_10675 [Subtercola boreus]RFA26500.1 hypothetical protein B7R25_10800 [Subtercola boreus]